MSKEAKIWIISSVPEGIFASCAKGPQFSDSETNAALMNELDVFLQHVKLDYLKENMQFELVRALEPDNLKKIEDADAYILGWSPNMVTDDIEWIRNLEKFVHSQVDKNKPVFAFCFGHQVLAQAFGWKVDDIETRHIWADNMFLNIEWQWDKLFWQLDSNLNSLWSHKQSVVDLGEGESLWWDNYGDNQIIKVWDNAWGVQFHPEFTTEFMSFLMKLMRGTLEEEWLDVSKLMKKLEEMKWINPSSELIQMFISQYWNK